MAKRIITISREFGSGGRFIGEEVAKKLGITYYVYHQNIFRKAQSYLPKKDYLPMHLPDVILQENPLRIWYMRHRERLYWNWQKKSPV